MKFFFITTCLCFASIVCGQETSYFTTSKPKNVLSKVYDGKHQFTKIISYGNDEYYAWGEYKDGSFYQKIFCRINNNGEILFTKKYSVDGFNFFMGNFTLLENGDFLLYGSLDNEDKDYLLLMSINREGDVLWAKRYDFKYLRRQGAELFVNQKQDGFVITSWHEEFETVDDLSFIKVSSQGKVQKSIRIGDYWSDDQCHDVIVTKKGYVAVGRTNSSVGWNSFIVFLDKDLNVLDKRLVGNILFDDILEVRELSNGNLLLAGSIEDESYLAEYDVKAKKFEITHIDVSLNHEVIEDIIIVKDGYILAGYTKDRSEIERFYIKVKQDFSIEWAKKTEYPIVIYQKEILYPKSDEILLVGGIKLKNDYLQPFILTIDSEFENCLMTDFEVVNSGAVSTFFNLKWDTKEFSQKVSVEEISVSVHEVNSYEKIDLEISIDDLGICNNEKDTISISNNFSSPIWNEKIKDLEYVVSKPEIITLSAKNLLGCTVNDTIVSHYLADCERTELQELLIDNSVITKGSVIQVENLFFEADSFNIDKKSIAVLDDLYSFLVQNPTVKIEVGGHTNNVPSADYCDILSTKRAKSIVEYLIQKGIAKERLTYKGYGKMKPLYNNLTELGRNKNQRVELTIIEF